MAGKIQPKGRKREGSSRIGHLILDYSKDFRGPTNGLVAGLLKILVAAITIGRVITVFALADSYLLLFIQSKAHWAVPRGRVRSITERLFLGAAAAAPEVGAGFKFKDCWCLFGDYRPARRFEIHTYLSVLHPLITPSGRNLATSRAIPASWTTRTTELTSLYASGCSSSSARRP